MHGISIQHTKALGVNPALVDYWGKALKDIPPGKHRRPDCFMLWEGKMLIWSVIQQDLSDFSDPWLILLEQTWTPTLEPILDLQCPLDYNPFWAKLTPDMSFTQIYQACLLWLHLGWGKQRHHLKKLASLPKSEDI